MVTVKRPTVQDRVQIDLKQEPNVLNRFKSNAAVDKSFPVNFAKFPSAEVVNAAGTPVNVNLPSEPIPKRQDMSVASSGGLKSKVQSAPPQPHGPPTQLGPSGWELTPGVA